MLLLRRIEFPYTLIVAIKYILSLSLININQKRGNTMKTNYHTHTYRCKHASGTELDYLEEALRKGLSIIGFSDHGPFQDNRYGLRMDFSDLTPYIDTLNELKRNYKDQIIVYSGLEIEYVPSEEDYYTELLSTYGLDYLVLAQHFYVPDNNKPVNIYSVTDSSQYIDYANSIVSGMESGLFKCVAHPDIMFVNDLPFDKNCEKACDIIISAAERNDFILEFNANGFRRGIHEFADGNRFQYPHKNFWNLVAQTSIKVLIGSDCHAPEQIWDQAVIDAHRITKELKLNIIEKIL
jgi:histidinol-phosphatase (PHP family)